MYFGYNRKQRPNKLQGRMQDGVAYMERQKDGYDST